MEETLEASDSNYTKMLAERGLVVFKQFSLRERVIKRLVDLIGGSIGTFLFFLAVIFLFIPYHLSSERDKGPMLYKQKRYGKKGEIFYILKFRTMIVGAEDYLNTHPETKERYHNNGNKLENDPRLTKVGIFIRNKSIDELPQFINVLKGEMSIVGPRPILLFEAKEYGEKLPYLLMCKPGITGYWTTHGRSKVLFPERANLELYYLQIHNLLQDIKLIIMTIGLGIWRSDAY